MRRRGGDVDGDNSALPSLPRRDGDGDGVAGALPLLRRHGGGADGTDGALLSLPRRERRALFAPWALRCEGQRVLECSLRSGGAAARVTP